jgi:hypothetical protein
MRHWIACSTGAAAVVLSAAASGETLGPAETNVQASLARIEAVDRQLHSVIALDPTALDQARAVDAGKLRGPLAGQPVPERCRRPPGVSPLQAMSPIATRRWLPGFGRPAR